jgi:hypothetical protein
MSFKKLKLIHIVTISALAGLLYGSKFAGLPLMTGICLVLGFRIVSDHFFQKATFQQTIFKIVAAILPVAILFLMFGGGKTIFAIVDFKGSLTTKSEQLTAASESESWFSTQYFVTNFAIYMQAARGESYRFLWDYTPLVSWWMAVLGWLGLGYGLTKKRWRWLSSTGLVTIALQLGIISTFYSADIRYIYNLLPTIILGMLLWFVWLKDLLKMYDIKKSALFISIVALIILSAYSLVSFDRLKSQVAINIKYAETPWWYLAIKEMDAYIFEYKAANLNQPTPIVVSPMIPYLIDFYKTTDFIVLPLGGIKDFVQQKKEIWGQNDYSDLLALYKQKIEEGHPVFVARYGVGNEKSKQDAFSEVEKTFIMEKVHSGCFDQCDIYKLSLNSEPEQ